MKNITKLLVLALAVMSVMLAFASCGCSHEEKVIPKKDATCTEVGATEGKECAKCGEILVAPEEIPMIAHTPTNAPKLEPTCTEDGHEAGTKCSVCDTALSGMAKLPAAHTPVDVEAKEETCAVAGHTAGKKCSVCNEILEGVTTIEPDLSKHNIREVEAVEVKCLENGSTAGGYCLNEGCNYEYGMEIIPYPGHKETAAQRLEPTCTTPGHEEGIVCSVCGEAIQGCAEIPAIGHNVTTWTMNITPALGVEGNKSGSCTVCQEVITVVYAAFEGYTFDEEGATAPTTTAEYIIASLVDRDAGKAVKITTARVEGDNSNGTAWLNAFGFTKAETLTGFTLSYDVMVPTTDADGDGVANEYKGDFFTTDGNPRLEKAVVNSGKDMFYAQTRIGCSTAANPYDGKHGSTTVDMWYLSLTTNGNNTDEVNVLRPDGTNFALDTWYNLSFEVDIVTGNVWVYVDGVLSLEMYNNSNIGSKAEKSAFTHAGYYDGAVNLKIGDFMRSIGHICYDNIIFAPYTLDHEGQHDIVPVEALAPTCTANGHTAGYKCNHCDLAFSGCETLPAAHTKGDTVEVITPAQFGVPGVGSTICTVCGTTYECEIPALPGFATDYEDGSLPTPYKNNASVTMTAEKEGENTVAHFSATKTGFESLFYWDANDMEAPVAGDYIVISTKIKFGDITVVNGYSAWAWNFGLTGNVGNSNDDRWHPGNYGLVIDDTATGAAHMKLTMGQNTHEFLKDQWYELTYVYSVYTKDDATVATLAIYVDGVLLGTTAEGAVSSNIKDGIVAVEFKTKNLNNFSAYNIYFDDTTLYETTEAPTFETPEVPAE